MDTVQITRALQANKITNKVFRGVYSADHLPDKDGAWNTLPTAYIANCSDASTSGSHWVAFYRENPHVTEVWDSYGKPLEFYNTKLLSILPSSTIVQQSQQLQQTGSTVCGQYCLFFILKRALGVSYKQMIHLFTDNLAVNDKMVCQYVNNCFALNTPVQDKTMVRETSGHGKSPPLAVNNYHYNAFMHDYR